MFRDFKPLPVARDQVDKVVVAFAQCSPGDRVVSLLDGAVAVVHGVHFAGGTCDLLPEFWESPAQVSLVEIPQNYGKTVQVIPLSPPKAVL